MLLKLATLQAIEAGEIDLVFRRWKKPTVKPGGRLRTAIGELSINAVEVIEPADLDDAQARRAGFASREALVDELFRERSTSGRGRTAKVDETSLLYRVSVSYLGPDSRAALREQLLDDNELAAMIERLRAMDRRAQQPWAFRALDLIATWPARRAPELAAMEGQETAPWKAQVRRLKELGLTESLPVGYQLSPRGEQVRAEAPSDAR
jgi:hypothetical protein